jgi:hypothetical protein
MDYKLYRRLVYLLTLACVLNLVTIPVQAMLVPVSLPTIQLAEQAIQTARDVDAPRFAADNFQYALDAFQQAQQSLNNHKTKDVERLALKSIRYAELSTYQARYVHAKEEVDAKISENARLRRELLLGEKADKS